MDKRIENLMGTSTATRIAMAACAVGVAGALAFPLAAWAGSGDSSASAGDEAKDFKIEVVDDQSFPCETTGSADEPGLEEADQDLLPSDDELASDIAGMEGLTDAERAELKELYKLEYSDEGPNDQQRERIAELEAKSWQAGVIAAIDADGSLSDDQRAALKADLAKLIELDGQMTKSGCDMSEDEFGSQMKQRDELISKLSAYDAPEEAGACDEQ